MDWNEFLSSKVVVNCKTEDSAKRFLDECLKNDKSITWMGGVPLKEYTNFEVYQSETCYMYEDIPKELSTSFDAEKGISYLNIQYAREHNYKVIVYDK